MTYLFFVSCFVGMAKPQVKFDLDGTVPFFHVKLPPVSCQGAFFGANAQR